MPTADLNGNQGSPNANPDTITGRFEENNNGRMYYIGREDNEDYKEETFKKKVFQAYPSVPANEERVIITEEGEEKG